MRAMRTSSRSSERTRFGRATFAPASGSAPALRGHEFRRLRALVYESCGIRLRAGKEELVRARLGRRLAATGARSFGAYLDRVVADAERGAPGELSALVDALTTNQTAFFREPAHFEYLRTVLLPVLARGTRPVRVWSAGCASGEEAYSLAMVLREELPAARLADARILATDISARSVDLARAGTYAPRALAAVPPALRRRYFARPTGEGPERAVVRPELRALVRVARLNLIGEWPMQGPFDAIFCRNVMIYFDAAVRQRLVERFARLLAPGGHLFVGHAESLGALTHPLRYVQPAVYLR